MSLSNMCMRMRMGIISNSGRVHVLLDLLRG